MTQQSSAGNSILYLDGVTVSFDGFRALNALSLIIQPGELRAIIGPNGAGKTTMMDVITGKTKPDEGEIFFEGSIDLSRHDEARIAELGIGRKFQKPTVFENHSCPRQPRPGPGRQRSPFSTLFHRESLGGRRPYCRRCCTPSASAVRPRTSPAA